MREAIGNVFEVICCGFDEQVLEPANSMGNDLEEWVVGRQAVVLIKPQIDRGGPRALEVDASFFRVPAVEIGPKRGTRDEDLPPSSAHVSQLDCNVTSGMFVPKVRNESKDLGRDAVDWSKSVLPSSGQTEDLKSVQFDYFDLTFGAGEYLTVCVSNWLLLPEPLPGQA